MNSALHSRLVEASQARTDVAIEFANYQTARQLSLDGNLPGEKREEWAALAEKAFWRLVDLTNIPTSHLD